LVIVVGSPNSSNSRRLREVSRALCVDAYLVDGPEEINTDWLSGKSRVGVTAGASAPEILVERVVLHIQRISGAAVSQLEGVAEGVSFPLPKELV